MKTLDEFLSENSDAKEISNPDFDKPQVYMMPHAWQKYVGELSEYWDQFTEREKMIIYFYSDQLASNEEWD